MTPALTLAFFRDVETMNIPDAPSVGARFGQAEEFVAGTGKRAPWFGAGTITPTKTSFFIVHLGVMRKRAVVQGVLRALDPDGAIDEDALAQVSGDASMGALVLDWEGRILCSQFQPAPFVFGVRRLREKKPLSDIAREMAESLAENLGKRFGEPVLLVDPFKRSKGLMGNPEPFGAVGAGKPAGKRARASEDAEEEGDTVYEKAATLEDLHTISRSLLKVAGLPIDRLCVRIVEREVRRKMGKPLVVPDFDEGMLPSFYAQDIDRVRKKKLVEQSPALQAYLGVPVAEKDRTDLLADSAALSATLAPEALSLGRWPSNPAHSLNIAQQAAVGQVRALSSGLLAINGPPGTGKTTLLRDLVADMVVERATRMADLEHADAGMVEGTITPDGDDAEPFSAALVREDLVARTGVVVASSNNAAVENVSLALPTCDSIDTDTFPDASYIRQAAKDMAEKMAQAANGAGASTEVWGLAALRLGNKDNIRTVFRGLSRPFAEQGDERPPRGGVVDALQDMGPCSAQEWRDTTRAFLSKRAKVEELLGLREAHWRELRNIPVLEAMVDAYVPLVEEVRAQMAWARLPLGPVRAAVRAFQALAPQPSPPSSHAVGLAFVQEAQARLVRARVFTGLLSLCWEVPDRRFFAQPADVHHRASVWTDTLLERARSDLFLAAMQVHEAFLRANQRKLYSYMGMLRKVLTGDVRVKEAMLLRVWNSLFVLSPVVSTTLASLRRLPIGDAWIGLLLVDEAGQATPQSVVGALARARKAVLVGDPLQIEPVFSVPAPIVKRLMREGDIPAHFSPLIQSAQTVADGVMGMGAWVPKGAAPLEAEDAPRPLRASSDPFCVLSGQAGAPRISAEGSPEAKHAGDACLVDRLGLIGRAPDAVPTKACGVAAAAQLVAARSFSRAEDDLAADGFVARADGTGTGAKDAAGGLQRVWTGMPLRVHRRCQEPMFGIANAISYGNQMVQGTPLPPAGALDEVVESAWFDVWGGPHNGKVRAQEMEFLSASLRRLHQAPAMLHGAPMSMFVISPFVEVAEACRQAVGGVFGWKAGRQLCPTGTVHTFQGKEADIVFLVLGTAPGASGHGSRLWAAQQANLLNVALTRARYRVYVVGGAEDWRALPFFDRLYLSLAQNGRVLPYPSKGGA